MVTLPIAPPDVALIGRQIQAAADRCRNITALEAKLAFLAGRYRSAGSIPVAEIDDLMRQYGGGRR